LPSDIVRVLAKTIWSFSDSASIENCYFVVDMISLRCLQKHWWCKFKVCCTPLHQVLYRPPKHGEICEQNAKLLIVFATSLCENRVWDLKIGLLGPLPHSISKLSFGKVFQGLRLGSNTRASTQRVSRQSILPSVETRS